MTRARPSRGLRLAAVAVAGLALGASCSEMPRGQHGARPTVATPVLPAVATGEHFVFAEIAPDPSLDLKILGGRTSLPPRLGVGGVDTQVNWTMQLPAAYKIVPGYWLIEDGQQMRLYLWDGEVKQLTDLGQGRTLPVTGVGRVISAVLGEDVAEISDLDLAARKLRTIYRGGGGLGVLGGWDGIVVGGDFTPGAIDVVVLQAGRPPRHHAVKDWQVDGRDAVRKGQLLLMKREEPRAAPGGMALRFIAGLVASLDLVSGQLEPKGDAIGCEVIRNNPEPLIMIQVAWGPRTTTSIDTCITWVEPPN